METGPGTTMQEQPPPPAAAGKGRKRMRVMVAIDESEVSFYALQWALEYHVNGIGIAAADEPSEDLGMITLVHVQPPFYQNIFPAGPGGAAFYSTHALEESVKKAQAENSAALLARALQMCANIRVKAETLVLEGDPKDMICQATEQMHVNLLVMGSRGLGKIKRALLGSVSDYCAHYAKCPVLIVKPPRDTGKGDH